MPTPQRIAHAETVDFSTGTWTVSDSSLQEHENLYKRIQAFSFEEGAVSLPFAARLARENGWTRRYADRVVKEYKRFTFLVLICDHPVTPSDQVDQVWHLHLTYSRSYWDHFCGEVLKRPLHHDPTVGGPEEAERFRQQYDDTLESYRQHFGEEAPADIWPDQATRFGDDTHCRRVNTKRAWVVRKPWFLDKRSWPVVLAAAGIALMLASGGRVLQQFETTEGIVLFVVLFIASLSLLGILRDFGRLRRCPSCGRTWALRKTGQRTGAPDPRAEWQCRHCDRTTWLAVVRGGIGAGHSGCAAGCGGGGCGGG